MEIDKINMKIEQYLYTRTACTCVFRDHNTLGPVVQNLICCFSFHISARLFISKLQRRKPLLIQTRSLNNYIFPNLYKQAVGKFALNFRLTKG
jgi:hypothetical protein